MNNKSKKVVFCDLDGTLIDTLEGNPHPKGVWDCRLKLDVWDKIKDRFPKMKYLFIVSNQGGISKGYVDGEHFSLKAKWVKSCLQEWLGDKVQVNGSFCISSDENNPDRKPNTGLLSLCLELCIGKKVKNENMVMIGDASGKEGDFSDSDLKCAENFGIDYIDVRDL